MRLPDPIANTTTEAYLAYKAGVLAQGDLKPKLYEPYIHLDAWLAYWTGLTDTYPVKGVGKNLLDYAGHFHGGEYNGVEASLDRETGEITVSGKPTKSWQQIVKVYDITDLLEDGETYTLSQSSYDNNLYLQVNAFNPGATPTYIYSFSGPTTFTVDKTAHPKYAVLAQTGDMSDWPSEATTITRTFQIEKGSTATAFEPYAGKPEMLTDEEAYIAYLSGVTDTYPEEFRDPADIRVAAYLRYIISARWGRPEYPVTNEELYLSMQKPPYVPSGDPSSDIEIDGTAKAPFQDVKMYGDTSQTTYTGKNLCGIPDQTLTYSGVTFTFKDGELTLDGTASGAGTKYFVPIKTTHLNGSYIINSIYVSGTSTAGGGTNFNLRKASDGSLISGSQCSLTSGNNSKAVSVEDEDIKFGIYLYPNGAKFENFKVKLQLVSGSTADYDFEPFVGGQPSPSPEYPQPIQTVTGRQVVKVEGKNLWGGFVSDFSRTSQGVSYINKADGTILANGTSSGNALSLLSADAVSNGRIITLQAGDYVLSGGTSTVLLQVVSSSGEEIAETASDGVKAFTLSEATGIFVRARMVRDTVADNVAIYPQLEKGSTATAYEPYSSNDYEINLGKNLFDIATASDVWIKETGIAQPNVVWKNSDFIKVEPNTTYTLSGSTIEGGFKQFQYHEYSSNNESSYINQYAQINWVNSITFTTHTGCNFIRVGYRKDSLKDIQLEAGTTATSYAPYFAPIELCKLGTYQDYIYKDGDDWKVHKAIDKHIFNGSESFILDDTYDGIHQFRWSDTSVIRTSDQNTIFVLSDRFRGVAFRNSWTKDFTVTVATDRDNPFRFMTSLSSTVEQLKTWLGQNNVEVTYVLATATDTTITDTDLIAQLEALVNGGAENGTTYIKVDATDPNLPGLLYVEAPKYD